MFRASWVFSALYLAVSGVSFAEEKKADPQARIDLHPDCVAVTPPNLLDNCGFENGDFSGWVQSGNPTETFIVFGDPAHSGNAAAHFGSPTLSFIAQTVPTDPNRNYRLSFWLLALGQPNHMQILWDTVLIGDLVNIGDTGYNQYTYQNLPTFQTQTEMKLGFSNVLGFFLLDDVVLEPNP
jgi:hypothetical protein